MSQKSDKITSEVRQSLMKWLESCRRGRRVARNTIAIGIVVLHHLRRECPTSKDKVFSPGGEVKGARSGLGSILETYGLPRTFLKEGITRQSHQHGQLLFEALNWGNDLASLSGAERETALSPLIARLVTEGKEWLRRQNLKLPLDRGEAPATWVRTIVEMAKERSGGVVEQHLVGAKLQRRFRTAHVANHPAHAADKQTAREGDFSIRTLVYHVTATPSRDVMRKCRANLEGGKHPILIVPCDQENRARVLAEEEGVNTRVSIISLENFVAFNIIELATEEEKDCFTALKEIVEIYNRRLSEVETDLSLQIEVQ